MFINTKHHIIPRRFGKTENLINIINNDDSKHKYLIVSNMSMDSMMKMRQRNGEICRRTIIVPAERFKTSLFRGYRNIDKVKLYFDDLLSMVGVIDLADTLDYINYHANEVDILAFSSVNKRYKLTDYFNWLQGKKCIDGKDYENGLLRPEYIRYDIPYEIDEKRMFEAFRYHDYNTYTVEHTQNLFR